MIFTIYKWKGGINLKNKTKQNILLCTNTERTQFRGPMIKGRELIGSRSAVPKEEVEKEKEVQEIQWTRPLNWGYKAHMWLSEQMT